MSRRLIIGGLIASILTSVAGFPFEPMEAYDWTGFFFLLFALSLFLAAVLIALDASRRGEDILALGFWSVALYGVGTAINGALISRDLSEVSVAMQPGIWGLLAVGLLMIGITSGMPAWVRIVGVISAIGHAIAATAVLFGADMPHTGAEPSEVAPLIVAVSKLLFWAAVIGWILAIRRYHSLEQPVS